MKALGPANSVSSVPDEALLWGVCGTPTRERQKQDAPDENM